jgi:hypothetical protein
MQLLRSLLCFAGAIALPVSVWAQTFVTSVPQNTYVAGSGVNAIYTDPTAALGKPGAIVGPGTGFDAVLSPVNGHYESSEIVGIGVGGSITLDFGKKINVINAPQFGVFTHATLYDPNYDGGAGATAESFASFQYAARRTAVIEVSNDGSTFVTLGRKILDNPSNYFVNSSSRFDFVAPDPAQLADYGKPFTGSLSAFNGQDFAGTLTALDGSAGGDWLTVPLNLGLTEFQFVRISNPLWLPTGLDLLDANLLTTVSDVQYFTGDRTADLYINAIAANTAAVPEPTTAAFAVVLAGACLLKRRTRRV